VHRELTTSRLLLRAPTPADDAEVYAIHSDPAANQHNPAGPATVEHAADMLRSWLADWRRDGLGYWMVRDRDTSDVIGVGGVRFTGDHEDGRRVLNLYYRFAPHAWGRGLATELCAAAIGVARTYESPLVVVAIVHPSNTASAAVARRAGLSHDGLVPYHGGARMRFVLPIEAIR